MKKQIIAAVMVAGLIAVGTASANRGNGNGGSNQDCRNQGGKMYQQLDTTTQDKISQFKDDTQTLRKEIVMKRAEKRAMMNGTNPDSAAAAKIAGELFDLRASMKVKAVAAGVDQYMRPRGMGSGSDGQKMGRRGQGQGSGSKGNRHGGCNGGGRF